MAEETNKRMSTACAVFIYTSLSFILRYFSLKYSGDHAGSNGFQPHWKLESAGYNDDRRLHFFTDSIWCCHCLWRPTHQW